MTITTLQVLHGSPVTTVKELCSPYKISDRTARTVIKEIEENHKDRYGDFAVLGDGALKRINYLVFTDYWRYRKMLQDKNARKHVPEYNPRKVADSLGFYGGHVFDGKN